MSGSFPASKGLRARIGCGQGDEVIRYEAMRTPLGAGYVQNPPRQSPISLLRVPQPTERHADLLNELLAFAGVHGNLVPAAHLAALHWRTDLRYVRRMGILRGFQRCAGRTRLPLERQITATDQQMQ
jgi:hypothetical protein